MGSQEPALGIRQKLKNTLTHQHCIQFQGIPKLDEIQCESSISQAVQFFSPVQLFATPWTATHQASLSITNSPELAETHIHRVGNAIQPSHPLLSPSPPAFNLSQIQGLFQESVLRIRWPKYLEFQLQHQSFQSFHLPFKTDCL